MAGNSKPNYRALRREGNLQINSYKFHTASSPSALFDEAFGSYGSGVTVMYLHDVSSHYIDFTLDKRSAIWAITTSDYPSYSSPLKVLKWNGTSFLDTGLRTDTNTSFEWHRLITLDAGRYRFELSISSYTVHSEWFIEDMTTDIINPLVKTNINDVKTIGDMLICEYNAPSNAVGYFSNVGATNKNEISSISSSTPNGSFYWIYVGNDALGRMKFVADRNIQHSISWDTLNTAGMVFGFAPVSFNTNTKYINYGAKPEYLITGDLTIHSRVKVGSFSSSGRAIVAMASSGESLATNVIYRLIVENSGKIGVGHEYGNGGTNQLYTSAGSYIELGKIYDITMIRNSVLKFYMIYINGEYKESISYSNNAEIHPTTNTQQLIVGDDLSSSSPFVGEIYNLTIWNKVLSDDNISILPTLDSKKSIDNSNIAFEENYNFSKGLADDVIASIRLLTGGISASDKENEWNKYIVESTLNSTITAGDNNVWNWNGIYSMTSTTGSGTNNKARRGNTAVAGFDTGATSVTGAILGFRPIMIIERINRPPVIESASIQLSQANVWYTETGDIDFSSTASDPDGKPLSFNVMINGTNISDYSTPVPSPMTINTTIPKSNLNSEVNSLIITVSDSDGGETLFIYNITKEDINTTTAVRKFDFFSEWENRNPDKVEIVYGTGLKLKSGLINCNGLVLTTVNNNITTHGRGNISSIVINGGSDVTEIVNSTQLNHIVRFLVSNDSKTTWYTFKDNSWAVADLNNIASTGMSKTELESIIPAQWQNWFVRGKLDFAVYISGHSIDGANPPTVKGITVNFPSNQAPIVSNPQTTPNTTHNNSIRVTANLIDREGDNITYQVWVGTEQIYPFSTGTWSSPVDSNFLLDFTISNSYFKTGNNSLMVKVKDERGQVNTWSTNVLITNTNPVATIVNGNFSMNGTIGDPDGDAVGYRVLINGAKKFPEDKEYTDLVVQPTYFEYRWTSKDLKFGQLNTITLEVIDSFGGTASASFQVMGTYQGLLFTDENNDYYSTDIGTVLKKLDFGTIVAGQKSAEKLVRVKNYNDFAVKDLTIKSIDSVFPQHTGLWFSKTLSPFTDDEMLAFVETLQSGEEIQFFVRIKTDVFATSGTVFEILAKANPI